MFLLPYRKLGKSRLAICLLGIGTTWFGRPWPPENHSYSYPSSEEIDNYLHEIFVKIKETKALLMIDTAAAYGQSEKIIGEYFRKNKKLLSKTFIATKWGEEFDITKHLSTLSHSKEHLLASVKRSLSCLGKIDLFYIHKASRDVLLNHDVITEMKQLKTRHFGDIRYIGASFSNECALEEAIKENLIGWADVIQVPACIFLKRPDLIHVIREKGINIVLNSVVRRGDNLPPKELYSALLQHDEISVILTGTRHHLTETIGYFSKSK